MYLYMLADAHNSNNAQQQQCCWPAVVSSSCPFSRSSLVVVVVDCFPQLFPFVVVVLNWREASYNPKKYINVKFVCKGIKQKPVSFL
jgi:hypothetical protein